MKSIACFSSSVRAACQHTSACVPVNRGLCSPVRRCSHVDFANKTVVAQQPRVTGVRTFHNTHVNATAVQQVSATPLPTPVPIPGRGEDELTVFQFGRYMPTKTGARPAPHLSPYSPYTKPQSNAAALVNIRSLTEGEVIPELCSKLAGFPSNDRAEGLATLLGACVEFGLAAHNPLVIRLINECLELLSSGDIEVSQLCHLGEVAYALEGRQSAIVTEVLDSIGGAVEEDVSHREAARVYSLLALCHDPASQRQKLMLSTLHRHTQRQVHRLKASQVSDILQSLLKLQQEQAISLVLRLSHRASRVFKAFRDDEVIKVLSALMTLGQHDEELLTAMEKHLPGRLGTCDPELISTVMEYCLQMRCRSEPIFEAVAENFVCHAERHTTLQIAKQIVAMGRLNYLPQCSSEMFKKLESILSTRFSQFQPRSLIEVLHACIHLERFPLNYMSRVFSPYFLQRLQAQGEPLDKNALGQLTQLHLSTSLECTHYWGPRLPYFLHVKRFSSVDQAFETPMESLLYRQVKGPLTELLGGTFYSTRTFTPSGYTIDVEIYLDEEGCVLPLSQWEHTYRRIALCLDGQNRFCSNTQHLLGKEATKRRHLRRMGYEVVQIPYFEFEKLITEEEKVQYLHNKIFPTIFKFSHGL
ncbi:FAST kinase domain-containing protein 3, mitochondrial-like [Epinephelus fuscoguttatus]|uniref:FAST kinase domain-containing protein 3, mitochondrial-like n=1 Tax=Epinephelus fuscoguttatus TaxID=293821 RepID=UPI0020D0AC5A|nr:FAST kinase domain-containing protein 3, mitochondrial-like [Epinephelus fuscoguttatus]XP_049450713.1 FAST kinase domain-containing protein 3, mitochondrial-like [Epinephelus fuscoguttatus]